MSRWLTLNVHGISAGELPESFDDWWTYDKNGVAVAYSFSPDMSADEAAAEIVKVGDDYQPIVDLVVALHCDDTSDRVRAQEFRPGEVKFNGVKAGSEYSGSHIYGSEDSEFLRKYPEDLTPVFGGNWTDD